MSHPQHDRQDKNQPRNTGSQDRVSAEGRRSGAYLLEVAVPIDAVAASFHELNQFFRILASLVMLFDLFETQAGEISIVFGEVSGKGIPAALLASVAQCSIRLSSAVQHETACETIGPLGGALC